MISRLIAIGLTAFAATFAMAEEKGEPNASAPAITVVEARRLIFTDNILVTGSLCAREEVLAGPEIDGYRITALFADEGDRVKAGQVLATLSRDALEAQLAQNAAAAAKAQAAADQARNQIAESEATLKQAEEAFNRVKALRESGAASQATYDEREALFRGVRARIAAQREGLRLAEAEQQFNLAQKREIEIKLKHTEVKAPADGIVSRRVAKLGAMSSASADALFRIVKDGEIELEADVPEFYLPRLKSGQNAYVEIAGIGDRSGKVRLVSPEVNTSTRLGKVRIFLGNDPDLRVGAFAKGLIDAGKREAVGVPASAVLYQNEGATVLVVQNNRVSERSVKTGILTGDKVEIRDGLKEGEVVVLRAGTLLRDGDVISPQFIEKKTVAGYLHTEARQ